MFEGSQDSSGSQVKIFTRSCVVNPEKASHLPIDASLSDSIKLVDKIVGQVYSYSPDVPSSVIKIYRQIAEGLPSYIPASIQSQAVRLVLDYEEDLKESKFDPNLSCRWLPPKVKQAQEFLVLVNLKSILAGAQKYLSGDEEKDSDFTQTILEKLIARVKDLRTNSTISKQMWSFSAQEAKNLRADELCFPASSLDEHLDLNGLRDELLGVGDRFPWGLYYGYHSLRSDRYFDGNALSEAERIAEKFNVNVSYVERYLLKYNQLETRRLEYDDSRDRSKKDKGDVGRAVELLSPLYRTVVEQRFGFFGPVPSLEEVGSSLGLSRERIRQMEFEALAKLRSLVKDLAELRRNYAAYDQLFKNPSWEDLDLFRYKFSPRPNGIFQLIYQPTIRETLSLPDQVQAQIGELKIKNLTFFLRTKIPVGYQEDVKQALASYLIRVTGKLIA